MMKEFTSNGVNWLIVQVPKESTEIELCETILCFTCVSYDQPQQSIELPHGAYVLHCIAEEAEGSQAHKIVEESPQNVVLYKDYEGKKEGYAVNILALYSLIRSLFTDWKIYKHVILKKI